MINGEKVITGRKRSWPISVLFSHNHGHFNKLIKTNVGNVDDFVTGLSPDRMVKTLGAPHGQNTWGTAWSKTHRARALIQNPPIFTVFD